MSVKESWRSNIDFGGGKYGKRQTRIYKSPWLKANRYERLIYRNVLGFVINVNNMIELIGIFSQWYSFEE